MRKSVKRRIEALRRKWLRSPSQDEILQAVVAERVRIWNGIFSRASVQPYTEPQKGGGYKSSAIIRIGEPTLKGIVLPELPSNYRENTDAAQVAAPEHRSIAGGGLKELQQEMFGMKISYPKELLEIDLKGEGL